MFSLEKGKTSAKLLYACDDTVLIYIASFITSSLYGIHHIVNIKYNFMQYNDDTIHNNHGFNIYSKKEWAVIANFALRCFSIVGSEAEAERTKHKQVIDHLRRNTSKELRIARLTIKEYILIF